VSAPYAPSAPQTAGPTTASLPYARPPRTGTTTASSSSSCRHPQAEPRLFKRRPSPLRVPQSLHPAVAAATGDPLLRSFPWQPEPPSTPLGFIAPPRVACCPAKPPPRRHPEPPRQPPSAAVDPPRRQPLRPNSDHPSTPGELLVEPSRLPDRERRRLAGIGWSRAAPRPRVALQAPRSFQGVLCEI
jgi:hypothetical protein